MTDKAGASLASGTAVKAQNWRPVVTADATAAANANNAAPLDLSRPANSEPLQHFELPGGCHFRTGGTMTVSRCLFPITAMPAVRPKAGWRATAN